MSVGFLLDTNVLSELMRPAPAPEVMAWFAGQGADQLHTSVITQGEILAGIALLQAGKRRDALAVAAHAIFEEDFQGRCLDPRGHPESDFISRRVRGAGKPKGFRVLVCSHAVQNGARLTTGR